MDDELRMNDPKDAKDRKDEVNSALSRADNIKDLPKVQNRVRKWNPDSNKIEELQVALSKVIDEFERKFDQDLPNFDVESHPSETVAFTHAEDDFIIRYLHRKMSSIERKGIEFVFREMFTNFPSKKSVHDLKYRAFTLCQSKHEINMWHAITNRYGDTRIRKDVREYIEFRKILTILRYYILPTYDPGCQKNAPAIVLQPQM